MRSQQLDMLRGVAILLVLGHHMDQYIPGTAWPPPAFVQAAFRGGWCGVDLFFVLSGFLVSGLLFNEYKRHGNVHIGRFLARRGLKIYPAFYWFLLLTSLLTLATTRSLDFRALLCEALFVQNYGPSLWGHTWSLAVEEHFYLLLCLFFWVRLRRPLERPFALLPVLFLVVGLGCLLARLWTSWHVPYVNKSHLFPTHLRLDSLLFGVLLSYFYSFHQERLARLVRGRRLLLLSLSLVLVAPVFFIHIAESFFLQTAGLTLLYLGFGGIMLASLYWQPGRSRVGGGIRGGLAWIGLYSYSIYIWHWDTKVWSLTLIRKALGGKVLPYMLEYAIYLLAALAIGFVMAKLIETPFLRLRNRWFPSRALAFAVPAESKHAQARREPINSLDHSV
jgi:peptidoglycan/LPS O-acetylase OafA/YrhL